MGEFRRGWRVLLGATLGVSVGISALPFYSAGVFVRPLEAEFGWTREQIALGSLASTFAVAFASPWIGALVDRFGVRIPAVLGLGFVALGFLALSRMPGGIGLFIGIQLGMAVLGASSSPLTFTRVVNAWFERAKGLALGITLAGIGVTAALAPSLVSAAVAENGWRTGYLLLAAVAALAAPIVFLLLGARSERPPVEPGAVETQVTGLEFREAARSPVFWRLVAAFLLLAVAVAGWVLHLIPMLVESGLSPAEAAGVQGALGLSVLAGRLVTGYLVDHLFAPRVAAAMLVLAAGGVALLAFGGPPFALPAAIALGFALGAEVDLIGYLTARYFGLRAYGRLYGLLYAAFIVGAGLSPVLVAWAAATSGGYPNALVGSVVLLLLVAGLFATAPRFPPSLAAEPGRD
jgi:MFS family permease